MTPPPLSPGATALLAYIRAYDYVTHVECERVLAPHLEVKGDWALTHPTVENLLFWVNVSEAFLDVLTELLDGGHIWRVPAEVLSYAIDGKVLTLPIPKRVQKRYARPHWVPTCLRPIERVSVADRKKYAAPAREPV